MTTLEKSLYHYNTDSYPHELKLELEGLESGSLPLHMGTTQGGIVDDSNISIIVKKVQDKPGQILANIGVFFTEVVGGCSCGDDPVSSNSYCEMRVCIDKSTADVTFELI